MARRKFYGATTGALDFGKAFSAELKERKTQTGVNFNIHIGAFKKVKISESAVEDFPIGVWTEELIGMIEELEAAWFLLTGETYNHDKAIETFRNKDIQDGKSGLAKEFQETLKAIWKDRRVN